MSTTAGIDMDSDSIKGVVLKAGRKGPIDVIGVGTIPVADLSRLDDSPDKKLAIGEKLKELVKSTRLKAETRRVGASGGNTSIRYLQIPPVPAWRLDMLVKYEVEERSEEKEANACDYHIMDVPETNGQYTVMIGMSREGYTNELLDMARSSGLGQVEIDLEALALFAAYYHGHGFDADKTVAIADIGADDITVLICKNGALYYARTMLGGGKRFTQNLATDLNLEFNVAEELKKTLAEIVFDVTPGASTVGRAARIQRTGGGTAVLPRSLGNKPGASGEAGALPARSAVTAAPGAGGEEARRARLSEGAKFSARPGASQSAPGAAGAAGGSQAKPPVSAAGAGAPAQAPATASPSGPGPMPQASGMRPMGELDFEIPSLEDLDLTPPDAPKARAEAPKPAPLAPPVPAAPAVPVAPVEKPALKHVADVVEDYDLQPVEDEKTSAAPKAPMPPAKVAASASAPASPAMTQFVPAPASSLAATQKMPALGASDIVDLVPVDAIKGVGGDSAASSVPPSLDALDASLASGVMPGEQDKRRRVMSAALVREAAGLCAAIENVTMTCKQQAKLPQLKLDRIYITGGGSKLKGLGEFMSRRLRVEVMPLEPLRCLSLDRLNPAVVAALKAEQHTLSVALGLALSDLRPGAFNFLLLPASVKKRKEFWARGAYIYYAAGAAALAMGVLLYTPSRNADKLADNTRIADQHAKEATGKNNEVRDLEKLNNEMRHRLSTITDNVQSGDYFLTVLAELKSKQRIRDDIYLTTVSTTIPNVVIAENDPEGLVKNTDKTPVDTKEAMKKAAESNKEPSTFQAQRRLYIRGFARGPQRDDLIPRIRDFAKRLVPDQDNPDNPKNLFKDIREIWFSPDEYKQGQFYLKEFVLEAYTEKPKEDAKKPAEAALPGKKGNNPNRKKDPAKAPPVEKEPKAPPVAEQPVTPLPVQPAAVQPVAPAAVAPGVLVTPAPVVPIPLNPPIVTTIPVAPVPPVSVIVPLPATPAPATPVAPAPTVPPAAPPATGILPALRDILKQPPATPTPVPPAPVTPPPAAVLPVAPTPPPGIDPIPEAPKVPRKRVFVVPDAAAKPEVAPKKE